MPIVGVPVDKSRCRLATEQTAPQLCRAPAVAGDGPDTRQIRMLSPHFLPLLSVGGPLAAHQLINRQSQQIDQTESAVAVFAYRCFDCLNTTRYFARTQVAHGGQHISDPAERRFRELLDYCPDAICVHQHGRLVYINAAGVRWMAANSADQLIG